MAETTPVSGRSAFGLGGRHGRRRAPPPVRATFHGELRPLLLLLFRNAIGLVLTLGIYRFWARTYVRRFFWNNVRIGGDALEYTGRPSELLIGFLIVIILLTLLNVAMLPLLALLSEMTSAAQQIFQPAYALLLLFLLQVAVYRARRYRLSRTAWRGVHFGQGGSSVNYAILYFWYAIIVFFTLGLGFPWMRVALQRYRTERAHFGNRYFRFEGRPWALSLRWLPVWIFLPLIVFSVASVASNVEGTITSGWLEGSAIAPVSNDSAFIAFLLLTAGMAFAYLWYRVAEFRYFVSRTYLGAIRFRSELDFLHVARYAIPYIVGAAIYFALIGLLLSFVFSVLTPALGEGNLSISGLPPWLFAVISLGALFLLALGNTVLYNIFMRLFLIRRIAQTSYIYNIEEADTIVQASKDDLRFGEGLADAFDVGNF